MLRSFLFLLYFSTVNKDDSKLKLKLYILIKLDVETRFISSFEYISLSISETHKIVYSLIIF